MDSLQWKRRSRLIPELWKSWAWNKRNQNKTSFWAHTQPRNTQEWWKNGRREIPFLWRCTEQSFGPRRAQSAHQCARVLNEESGQQSVNSVLRAGIHGTSISAGSLIQTHTCSSYHYWQLWQLQDTGDPRTGDSREQGWKTFLSCMSCKTKRTVCMRNPTSSRDSTNIRVGKLKKAEELVNSWGWWMGRRAAGRLPVTSVQCKSYDYTRTGRAIWISFNFRATTYSNILFSLSLFSCPTLYPSFRSQSKWPFLGGSFVTHTPFLI